MIPRLRGNPLLLRILGGLKARGNWKGHYRFVLERAGNFQSCHWKDGLASPRSRQEMRGAPQSLKL